VVKFLKVGNVRIRKDDDGESVSISADYIKDSVDYINEHGIKKVSIDYNLDHLDFLSECPELESISIGEENLKDATGLYHLKNIKSLSVNDTRPSLVIDFEKLPSLEVFWGKLPNKATGVETLANLKEMRLWSYKPKTQNLEAFSKLRNLKSLELIQSAITSLKGAEGLTSLEKLGLYYLRTFNDLKAVKYLSKTLRVLEIENCKKISEFTPIGELKGLEELRMMDCGEIESIQFVHQLHKLRMLAFSGTTIMDGDLSLCEEIEHVYFTQKKHYTHRLQEYSAVRKKETETMYVQHSNHKMPTVLWRERMEEGDDMFSDEALVASEKALQQYVAGLQALHNSTEEEIKEKVKEVVTEFNRLNEEYGYFIETMEREELYEFIDEKAQEAGLESDDDITEEWREW
jgi:hypothetical protein